MAPGLSIVRCALALNVVGASYTQATAQSLDAARTAITAPIDVRMARPQRDRHAPNAGRMIVAGVSLGAVGAVLGALTGGAIAPDVTDDNRDWVASMGIGATIGEAIGLSAGVHNVGDGRASYWRKVGINLLIAAPFVAASVALNHSAPLIGIMPAQLVVMIAMERHTYDRIQTATSSPD